MSPTEESTVEKGDTGPSESIMNINPYDKVRHIPVKEAHQLVQSQEESDIPVKRLKDAVKAGDVRVYDFKGEQYLDRLDIGRVYHKTNTKKEGLTIDRYFSTEGEDPYESVGEWETIKCSIKDYKSGETVFEMDDAYFPVSWANQNSKDIVAQKYFFKPHEEDWKVKIKEKLGREYENSPKHLIERVTNFVADEGEKMGYFKTSEDKKAFADELKWLQINRRFAFNSPVQFNAGIFNEYGITGSDGINYFRDSETGEITRIEKQDYLKPQCHACFIKGPRDDLESILNHAVDEGAIFSHGSGIGQDIGALREEGGRLSGGGEASGAISFLKIYDDGAGTIKSGGKSRRAARMTTMKDQHPEIMQFIRAKVKEDHKALTLMKAGYEGGMDGEAYSTVTLQNTNLTVRVGGDFFDKVESDGNIQLRSVVDDRVVGEVPAKAMLEEIAFGSWRIGDPAIQYEAEIQKMHTGKNSGDQQSTNPCSEYLYLNDTACNLLSHNLIEYSNKKGEFNVEEFKHAVRLTAMASDIINGAASYPVEDIARISPEFRTIGVGFANAGALLMRRGLAYDSDKGRSLIGAISSLMTGVAYRASTEV